MPAHPRRPGRSAAAIVLAVACAAGLAASAPPTGLGDPLWTTEVSLAGFSIGPAAVYVSEPGARTAVGRNVNNGRLRWRLSSNQLWDYTVDVGGGVAAVATHFVDGEQTTTLVDEDTGRVLARVEGRPVGRAADGVLLVGADPLTLAGLDVRTGMDRWRHPTSAGWFVDQDADGVPREVATLSVDGTLRIVDLATGAVPTQTGPGAVPVQAQVELIGGVAVSAERTPGRVTLTGLSLRGRGWTAVLPVREPLDERTIGFGLFRCGDLLCLMANGGTAVYEPGTGALRFWAAVNVLTAFRGGLLAAPGFGSGPSFGRGTGSRELSILDPRSGRVLATVAGEPVAWSGSGGRVLLAREGAGRTAFVVLDERGSRGLGSVPGTGLRCEAAGAHLACQEPAGLLRVWKIHPSR